MVFVMEEIQEKRKDLIAEKRKQLIKRIVSELSHADPDLYYRSTSEIARQMEQYLKGDNSLNADEIELLQGLDYRDIHALLSLH